MHKDLRCHSVFVFGQLCQSSTEPCASKPCKFALPLLIAQNLQNHCWILILVRLEEQFTQK